MNPARALAGRRSAMGRLRSSHVPPTRWLVLMVLAAALVASGVAHADVPTTADLLACNREAREGLRAGTASPIAKDEAGAHAARQARAVTVDAPGAAGRVTQSGDPQIHGMDVEGAQDAAYRAAYRVCMRRKGF